MAVERYRGIYKPANGIDDESIVDSKKLDQLPTGAILVIAFNKDGTREIVSQKDTLTPKEQKFFDYGQRHLDFKHDGGDTPEAYEEKKSKGA